MRIYKINQDVLKALRPIGYTLNQMFKCWTLLLGLISNLNICILSICNAFLKENLVLIRLKIHKVQKVEL